MALLFGSFAILLILGCAIPFTFGIASLFSIMQFGDIPLQIISQRVYTSLESFPLLALPLFILAGKLMSTGSISQRMFRFILSLVGHFKGGLCYLTVITSMIFAGMSGAAIAEAAALGGILIPQMEGDGYDKGFSSSLVAASSTIGPIIPPSVPMIIFGWMAGVSIGDLFLGGIIPGVLIGLGFMIYVFFMARKHNYPSREKANLSEVWISFKESILALIIPLILMGGLLGGIFTATEAAAVCAVYAMLISMFVYKEMKFSDLPHIFKETAIETGNVGIVLAFASVFSWLLSVLQMPTAIQTLLQSISISPYVLIIIINVLLLFIGMVLNTTSALVVFTPMLVVVGNSIGMDTIQLGVMVVVNLCIGMLTPPVGVVLFVVSQISKMSVMKLAREVIPLIIIMIIVQLLISYVPAITTLIPSLV